MQDENVGCKDIAMWSLWTLYICLAVAVSIGRGDGPNGQGLASARVEALLSKMTIEDKVGQMTQLDLALFVSPETGVLDEQKLLEWITRYRIGSLFNTPFAGHTGSWTAPEWRRIIRRCQQIASGAGSRLPLLIGLDSVHGANYVEGAVLFPQQIALAATFNPSLAGAAGRIAARDTRAAGIPWLFAPILGIATQPLWPRVYETFGEDPLLASQMGGALIKGIQASFPGGQDEHDGEPLRAAACMKHFLGYSHPSSGKDRSPSRIPEQELLEMYLPPFQAAVDSGVASAMESYNELNGTPLAASRRFLVDVLRGRMGFLGMLVTDYSEIVNLEHKHRVSDGSEASVEMAMQGTSIDVSMVPTDSSFTEALLGLVRAGKVSENRINLSVRRILTLKESLGLLDSPVPANQSPLVAKVGSTDDKRLALQAAREAITLLKNSMMPTHGNSDEGEDGAAQERSALPLDRTKMSKVLVVGPASHSLRLQSGGWTKHWQGAFSEDEFSSSEGRTILEGMQDLLDGSLDADEGDEGSAQGENHGGNGPNRNKAEVSTVKIVHKKGITVDGAPESDRDAALSEAFSADAVLVCVGEGPFAEKNGDITELALPRGVSDFVHDVRKVADAATPVILVLVEGRPRLLGDLTHKVDAVLHTYLLGPSGGRAIAEVLFGDVNPSGRLPMTYPRHAGNIPLPYHRPFSEKCQRDYEFVECEVEWWFGEGLSYTEFEYSNLKIEPDSIVNGESFTVSLQVRNMGDVAGNDSVLLFATDVVRKVAPRYKQLKGFDKIALEPGESKQVTFALSSKDLEYIDVNLRPLLEEGLVLFGAGATSDCRTRPEDCASLTVSLSDDYEPACQAACNLWYPLNHAAPGGYVCPLEAEDVFRNKKACMEECVDAQWGWDYVSCLEQAVWTGTCAFNQHCRAVGADAVPPRAQSGSSSGGNGKSSPITNIGDSTAHPRTGSVDLAVGVGVGMCIGGAAVFVVLATMRKRRLQRWRGGGEGIGYEGMATRHESKDGERDGGENTRRVGGSAGKPWAKRRRHKSFSFRRRAASAASVRQVSLELGKGGFDGHDSDDEFLPSLELTDGRNYENESEDERKSDGGNGGRRGGGEVSASRRLGVKSQTRDRRPEEASGRKEGIENRELRRNKSSNAKHPGPRKSGSQEALLGERGGEGVGCDDDGPSRNVFT